MCDSYSDWTSEDLRDEVDDNAVGLSAWEVDFIESVTRQSYPITAAQRAKLIEILEAADEREDG